MATSRRRNERLFSECSRSTGRRQTRGPLTGGPSGGQSTSSRGWLCCTRRLAGRPPPADVLFSERLRRESTNGAQPDEESTMPVTRFEVTLRRPLANGAAFHGAAGEIGPYEEL